MPFVRLSLAIVSSRARGSPAAVRGEGEGAGGAGLEPERHLGRTLAQMEPVLHRLARCAPDHLIRLLSTSPPCYCYCYCCGVQSAGSCTGTGHHIWIMPRSIQSALGSIAVA